MVNRTQTRAEQIIEMRRNLPPEISGKTAKCVTDQRRETLNNEVSAGIYREKGALVSLASREEESFAKQTPAGFLSHSAGQKNIYKQANGGSALTGASSSNWRGSNDTVRQSPEVYSPLWLNSNLNLPRDRASINAWSRSFFALNPIVHNAITLHSTYPFAKLSIKCKDPGIEKFFSQMMDEIDLMNICTMIAQEYYVLGEAFPFAELNESTGKWSRIMLLNPDYINVQRSVVAAEPIISLRPDENLKRVVHGNKPADIQQRKQLDPSIIEHVRRNENIPLNNFYVSHIARRISPYEIRGTGMIVSAFRPLMLFDKLRECKYAQADNMVNPLTLVKIGGPEHHPTPVDLEHWRNVFEECHDEETEVLTDSGFRKFADVIEYSEVLEATGGGVSRVVSRPKTGVKIACFNPENEQLEYHEPTESHLYDYSGEMYHFHNDKMDIKVTPNHNMWVQRKRHRTVAGVREAYWSDWEKTRVKDMKFFDRRFRSKLNWIGNDGVKSVKVAGKEIPIELYLEFLGYVISEGCIYTDGKSQHTVGITQTVRHKDGSHNPKSDLMRECANKFAQAINKSYSDLVKTREDCGDELVWDAVFSGWDLFKHFVGEISGNGKYKSMDKRIPRWVLGLSPRLLNILLKALVLGDGTKTIRKIDDSIENNEYFTSSTGLANDVYEAVYKSGFVPTMFEVDDECDNHSTMYTVSWSNSHIGEFPLVNKYSVDPRTKEKKEIVSKEEYAGKVWCFTVPTGLFVTRRNGRITIQGNSQYDKDFKIFTHNEVAVERVGYSQGIYDTSADVTQLIKEIYIGLMVPSVIMDGSDTTYATGSVALDVLRQRYMQFRNYMSSWLRTHIFAPISEINEFYEYVDGEKVLIIPEVDWNHMSLFDMDSYIQSLKDLTAKQGDQPQRVSLQTLYRSIGLEYEEEQRKLRYEAIQEAIRQREVASLQRYSLHELKSLGPNDDIEEVTQEPVPGESPYIAGGGGGSSEGGGGGGAPSSSGPPGMGPTPGAPPPAPVGGGKPPGP